MKTIRTLSFFAIIFVLGCTTEKRNTPVNDDMVLEFQTAANDQLLDKWYPLVLDTVDGGYYSEVTFDFKLGERHDKMIVTQARHIWTTATAAMHDGDKEKEYLSYAEHGFKFLRDHMWDGKNGGFHNLVTKKGKPIVRPGEAKTAYGNSFAIYGLAVYYAVSKNGEALDLAKQAFRWLEEHSHDSIYKGYYQSMDINGTPIVRTGDFPSTSDIGYKDQNSSIHLLEALTALYKVWPDPLVGERVGELLVLIRDSITTNKGYMNLFFEADWTPVTFVDTPKDTIQKHYYLDHVSFGHDVETAYLMLEASEALGGLQFDQTLKKGKIMVDHAITNGWDNKHGGFYDGGYYYAGDEKLSIVNYDKNWWSQAEGLNSLLMMDTYFPKDSINYRAYFDKLWQYTNTYIMDPDHGGWYEWGIDTRPETKFQPKGHIWKGAYHNYRALVNCAGRLEQNNMD
ncbi:AGE family epimerase/isomerase [Muricauda sp. MAR_2010_75]|uniref:AGE family epimerase/isomerase n=1 Tax=Allomuricauda sp. MAR_2010_75 TaxID=1250232 RepID=UPI000564217F|nr:AGE family epimerase/isomerase [Muricauda sp. MAR_2010_75]